MDVFQKSYFWENHQGVSYEKMFDFNGAQVLKHFLSKFYHWVSNMPYLYQAPLIL